MRVANENTSEVGENTLSRRDSMAAHRQLTSEYAAQKF